MLLTGNVVVDVNLSCEPNFREIVIHIMRKEVTKIEVGISFVFIYLNGGFYVTLHIVGSLMYWWKIESQRSIMLGCLDRLQVDLDEALLFKMKYK